jgi:hypothetical protein
LVEQAGVAQIPSLALRVLDREEAKRAEPVVDRDDNEVVTARKSRPFRPESGA